jgi:hypothetical protein
VINGVNIGTRTEMNLPHVVNGMLSGANYTTTIDVTNLSSSPQTVSITFHPETGSPVVASRDIAGNGALREAMASLFGLTSEFQNGWVSVTGAAPITGFAAYADDVGGGLAAVPVTTSQTNLLFSHIADGPPQWQTGLALLNATNSAANVELFVLNPSGSLVGKTSLSIDPGHKIARVIHDLIPEASGMNGGYVPLYGIELFYTQDLKLLSNVAAGGQFVPGTVICATYKSIVTQPCP